MQARDGTGNSAIDERHSVSVNGRPTIARQVEGPFVRLERKHSQVIRLAAAGGLFEGAGNVAYSVEGAGARFESRLTAQNQFEFLLVLLLIEQLPAGNAVNLGAHLGDAILITELHFGLPGNEPGQYVLAEREISRRADCPHCHDGDGGDHPPECERSKSELMPAMRWGIP